MKIERATLTVVISLLGLGAGWISLSHVYTFVMRYSPDGTPWSTGVILAGVSELMPVGVLLYIRVQQADGLPVHPLAWWMLVGAGLFSLTAQWATAAPTVFGWVIAGAATLFFMGLCKLMLGKKSVANDESEPVEVEAEQKEPEAQLGEPEIENVEHGTAPTATLRVSKPRPGRRPGATGSRAATAERVRAARNELGINATQAAVAERAGCSAATVSRIENPKRVGDAQPSLRIVPAQAVGQS